ncbi:MAG: AMMECR1 domain-containing protein, partial [FCB group bacterium]|nr:AMMECR1 domain-containing protein [FCB group bacterium]
MNNIERSQLLDLARKSIEHYLDRKEQFILKNYDNSVFNDKRAVFVTLHKDGNLRGCIGQMHAQMSLDKAVIE